MSSAHYVIQRLKTMVTFTLDTVVEHYIDNPYEYALGAVIKTRDRVLSVINSFQEEGDNDERTTD